MTLSPERGAILCGLVAVLCLLPLAARAAGTYRVEELKFANVEIEHLHIMANGAFPLRQYDNSTGAPVGWVLRQPDGTLVPITGVRKGDYIWTASRDGLLAGSQRNDKECLAQADGSKDCADHPFIWDRGQMKVYPTLGGRHAQITAINKAGDAIGWSEVDTARGPYCLVGNSVAHGFLIHAGHMTDIGAFGQMCATPNDINDAGQIVGAAEAMGGKSQAFLFQNGKLTWLGGLGGDFSEARRINAQGDIVGSATTADGSSHSFLYHAGKMQDLGTGGGANSRPMDIDDAGEVLVSSQITGKPDWRAFVYRDGVMRDVNDLVDLPPDEKANATSLIVDPSALGPHGEIVATGLSGPAKDGTVFFLTPIGGASPPSRNWAMLAVAALLLLCGAAFLLFRRRAHAH